MDQTFIPCDRCGVRAFVHVTLDTLLPLSFCLHHFQALEEALTPYELVEHRVDERKLLTDA
jgi:hypothetical protein